MRRDHPVVWGSLLLLLSSVSSVEGSACSSTNTPVAWMCKDNTAEGKPVYLDAGTGDMIKTGSCYCTLEVINVTADLQLEGNILRRPQSDLCARAATLNFITFQTEVECSGSSNLKKTVPNDGLVKIRLAKSRSTDNSDFCVQLSVSGKDVRLKCQSNSTSTAVPSESTSPPTTTVERTSTAMTTSTTSGTTTPATISETTIPATTPETTIPATTPETSSPSDHVTSDHHSSATTFSTSEGGPVDTSTDQQKQKNNDESFPVAAVAGGIGGGLVFLIIIGLIIFYCRRKSHHIKYEASPQQGKSNGGYEDLPQENVKHGPMNHAKGKTHEDKIMIENDLYVSAGQHLPPENSFKTKNSEDENTISSPKPITSTNPLASSSYDNIELQNSLAHLPEHVLDGQENFYDNKTLNSKNIPQDSPPSDVYAVVDKSRKSNITGEVPQHDSLPLPAGTPGFTNADLDKTSSDPKT